MYHYTFGGLQNVYLVNGYKIKQTPMGEAVAFTDGEGLETAICKALAKKGGRLTGAEFRFVRTSGLLMSQPALGKLWGVDAQSIARWEKSGKIPKWADKLVRLVYIAKVDGNEPINRAIEGLQVVERMVHQKIVMHARRGQWESSAKDEDAPEPVDV